jgi:hypothetical protein
MGGGAVGSPATYSAVTAATYAGDLRRPGRWSWETWAKRAPVPQLPPVVRLMGARAAGNHIHLPSPVRVTGCRIAVIVLMEAHTVGLCSCSVTSLCSR